MAHSEIIDIEFLKEFLNSRIYKNSGLDENAILPDGAINLDKNFVVKHFTINSDPKGYVQSSDSFDATWTVVVVEDFKALNYYICNVLYRSTYDNEALAISPFANGFCVDYLPEQIKDEHMGYIFLTKSSLSPSVIAHECLHAALKTSRRQQPGWIEDMERNDSDSEEQVVILMTVYIDQIMENLKDERMV